MQENQDIYHEVCPISHTHVDERVARLNGFVSLIFVVAGIYFPILWIIIAIDFALRSFSKKFSPVARFNKLIIIMLKLKPIPIDAAPKKFAAKMGLAMSILLIIFNYFNLQIAINTILIMFIGAISAEAFFNYCVGCKIYSILIRLNIIKIS
jgi:hypothetical protein